jgi:hypothetical protein
MEVSKFHVGGDASTHLAGNSVVTQTFIADTRGVCKQPIPFFAGGQRTQQLEKGGISNESQEQRQGRQ